MKNFVFSEIYAKVEASNPQKKRELMDEYQNSEITRFLQDWNDGDAAAGERLLPIVYQELKRNASFLMTKERAGHTLQPTALVHEAFLKLTELKEIKWKNRRHFFHFTAKLMRQILVDHVRHHTAIKRGSNIIHFSIDDLQIPAEERADSILRLDEVLTRLAKLDEQQARIVEMRYFGGLKNADIAEALDISERTVGREWQAARVWLYRELNNL